jgi:pectin methylesterase-like acyl-CoA thioesterase
MPAQKWICTVQMTLGIALLGISASAATICVNPGGTGGCGANISAAVAAAAPNDTITVAKGVYHEDVIISKPVSLIGEGDENTIIDATGLSNALTSTVTTIPG